MNNTLQTPSVYYSSWAKKTRRRAALNRLRADFDKHFEALVITWVTLGLVTLGRASPLVDYILSGCL